ncbi:hypothetical protein [Ruminiclostridium cellobioparum]|nr:hypothetical protein [Ruminiclostridium cellobioparum]
MENLCKSYRVAEMQLREGYLHESLFRIWLAGGIFKPDYGT